MWGDDVVVVLKLDIGFCIFKARDGEDLDRILGEGPYHITGKYLVLRKWELGISLKKSSFSRNPVWIKLYNIAILLKADEELEYIYIDNVGNLSKQRAKWTCL